MATSIKSIWLPTSTSVPFNEAKIVVFDLRQLHKEVGVYYESRREAIHSRGKGLVRPREPRLLKRLVAESKPGDSFQHLINRFASVSQLFWVCGRDRGPSGSHLPSFRHHYRLLGHPFHQRDFTKWALLDHGQCCCIIFLPPFVTSGLI
jgi:hypothetical protein